MELLECHSIFSSAALFLSQNFWFSLPFAFNLNWKFWINFLLFTSKRIRFFSSFSFEFQKWKKLNEIGCYRRNRRVNIVHTQHTCLHANAHAKNHNKCTMQIRLHSKQWAKNSKQVHFLKLHSLSIPFISFQFAHTRTHSHSFVCNVVCVTDNQYNKRHNFKLKC